MYKVATGAVTIPYLASLRAYDVGITEPDIAGGYHVDALTCVRETEPTSAGPVVPCVAAIQTAPFVSSWMYCEV